MSAAEAPKSEQIQANVAAALSRLRGELGASSSPVAGTVAAAVPKTSVEPAETRLPGAAISTPGLGIPALGIPAPGSAPAGAVPLGPLPAGPVRLHEVPTTGGIRPFEPTLGAALGTAANTDSAPESAPAMAPGSEATEKPDL